MTPPTPPSAHPAPRLHPGPRLHPAPGLHPAPRLPSRRVGAVLAAATLAVGVALGALLGPAPAAPLSSARAAAVGRALVLLVLGSGAGSGGSLLAASGATAPVAPPAPSASHGSAGSESGKGGATGVLEATTTTPNPSPSSSSPAAHPRHRASSGPASPTPSTAPGGGGEGEREERPAKPLAPVASAWVIVLPYGSAPAALEGALKQPAAAPYLAQLRAQGTVLGGYTPLAAAQLAGAATLLSGQVGASVVTLSPPPPAEPANVQAADAYLQAVVPQIVASPAYAEHGLIAIAFAPPAAGAAPGPAYPAGTSAATLAASAVPGGVLLLSPFLRHPGGRLASAYEPASPGVSLEGLLTPPKPTTHQ